MSQKKRRRRRRRNSNAVMVLVVILLIVVVAAVGVLTAAIKRRTPSDTRMDLNTYYGLEKEDDVALVLQNTVSEAKGKLMDGHVYLDYDTVSNVLGGRFYWEADSSQMLYTTPNEILTIAPESTAYTVNGENKDEGYKIIRQTDDKIYLALDFIQKYMKITSTVTENPNKAVIRYQWGSEKIVKAKNDTVIRYRGGIKSDILADVDKGTELILIEELDNWSQVATSDGFNGYVAKEDLTASEEKDVEYDGSYKEEFTSLTRDHKINLAWHQVTSEDANAGLAQTLESITGINVISPTWFSVTGAEGTISSLASADYVKLAHEKGLEVWGLIDNFNKDVSTLDTLSNRTSREHLIQKLIEEAARVGLDGINVDFETLTQEEAPHFIQFIRELSISCRKNNLVLSIDDPVPQFTSFYNRKEQGIVADYVIIMGYDEHTDGTEKAGSVASLPFVEEGIQQTLKEVPKNKVINGVPFYTRLWFTDNAGTVTSEIMGMDQADKIVAEMGMEKYWNKDVSQNYAELATDNGLYQIWLEDEQSLDAKMQLIQKYELGGVAEWKLGFERADVWNTISQYLQ
ncbi:glycosyl hydrolase family 18 protein [Blautia producta]|uniref:Sporulation-specific glycosylase YdhD n=1 Tax=Blautia producta TaxID=33035 RepID=A0A4P6LWL5_9FIRM|nr:glycosyl hydrolase family 18 protein [Blautia producta]QBE96924.1 Putative sporulation-specific glycosylase YdhD [Blautia producta]